jgi:hypothetical protein
MALAAAINLTLYTHLHYPYVGRENSGRVIKFDQVSIKYSKVGEWSIWTKSPKTIKGQIHMHTKV